ncbi:MAG: TIGR03960 family B12-binding radical SAM protein [Candidatus Omnitrophota bacterium]|jgi:radical SAM family uncharacterized protein
MLSDEILLCTRKPGQYIGQEWNVSRKDFDKAGIRFALCFPDLYEIGMSNIGIRIVYDVLNKIDDVACERVFSPDKDMEEALRSRNLPLSSLESGRGLKEFDMIGFSLGYELLYTNVLNILDLADIPFASSERDAKFPLIIGGGPCVLNPEPIAEFFDLFVIGEAEEVIVEIMAVYRKSKDRYRSGELSKQDLLISLAQIEGIYVPSLYKVSYDSEGHILKMEPCVENVPEKIRKRYIKDLDKSPYPLDWLVPYVQVVHDRASLELARGCPNACRFCQARSQYYPYRIRRKDTLIDHACELYKRTGYDEISLGGLSVSDYPGLEELLITLTGLFKAKAVSLSLPSVKAKTMLGKASEIIASIKKTGLTFAPEAGTEKMRGILNKDFNAEEFFKVLEQSYAAGYQHVKLYYMTGLPEEETSDLDGIADFTYAVSQARRKVNLGPAQVNISINTLIPKPHTAFERLAMDSLETIAWKQNYLRDKMKNRRFKLNFHNRQMSFMEGVFSRGDRRLGKVIVNAFRKGARFDAWSSYFNFERWMEAFRETEERPEFYLRKIPKEEILPWDLIDLGVEKETVYPPS